MPTQTFDNFDPSIYQRAPRSSVESLLTLGRALLAAQPSAPPGLVQTAIDKLTQEVQDTEAALTVRHRELDPGDPVLDTRLDAAIDNTWTAFRDRIQSWLAFETLDQVLNDRNTEGVPQEIITGAERAERARRLLNRLFLSEGLTFLRQSYTAQVERMGAILRVIEEDGLADDIDDLAGFEVLPTLTFLQTQYQAMVEERLLRDNRLTHDLGQVRGRLQRAIGRYSTSVLSMLDEDQPSSLELVVNTLRPIETFRAAQSRPSEPIPESPPELPAEPATDAPTPEPPL